MKLSSHHFIDEHLPDIWLERGRLLFINQEKRVFAAKAFSVAGQPMTHLSAGHLASWRAAAMAMLNTMELHTQLDFYWTVENDYSELIEGHQAGADPTAPVLARQLLEERVSGYKDAQIANELRYRKLYVFVNLEPSVSQRHLSQGFGHLDTRMDHRLLLTEWKAASQKLDQLVDTAQQPFQACGMNTSVLDASGIHRLYRTMLSPHRHLLRISEPKCQTRASLLSQTLLSDIERVGPFLHYDEHFHAFISMANLPQETRTGFLCHLFNLSFPDYSIKVTIRTTEKQKEIRNLQSDYGSKRGLQVHRERSGKPVNIEMETQAEEIREEIRILTQSSQQIFHLQCVIHLRHPDQDELLRRIDEVFVKMGYCNGTQAVLEKIAAPEALRACLPGWTREERLDRFHMLKSANAADFIPAHTDFIGTGRSQLIFPTPEGGLMGAHVFTSARPFHNVVVGETGGGKTFLLNSIVTQLVGQGLKSLSVISTKDEFGPLMSIYQGEKISFSENHPVFLNPCAISGKEPTLDELANVTLILETILGEEPNDGARKLRQSRILKAAWVSFGKHGNQTRLRHLLEAFRSGWEYDDARELEKLALILEPYAHGGIYGEFFDSDTLRPLNLSNPFKFFDFSGIQKNRNLAAIMIMALTLDEALRLAKLPRHYPKALLLDECWAFVNSATGGDFIENALRVYRAYNCAVFLSTQVITDFLNSRIAPVVMSNCHNFFLLRTRDRRAIAIIQKELSLTDELVARFGSMPDPSESGYSRFIYVHRAESQQIAGEAMNRIGRAEALLYSTSADISQIRDQILAHASDPWEAISALSRLSDQEIRAQQARIFSQGSQIIL